MIQLLGLRKYFCKESQKEKTFDAFFKENWRAPSVADLFLNLQQYVDAIPQKERWNIYYTAAICTDKKRVMLRQEIMPFDVDGILVDRRDEYIPLVLGVLGVPHDQTGIVFSGNGLQFIVGLAQPFANPGYFDENRDHYKALCVKIDQALQAANLPGKADPSVFSPARVLRLPGTENRKPDKKTRLAELIQGTITPVPFDLAELSGLPKVSVEEQVSAETIRSWSKPDADAVLEGCQFLKHCAHEPAAIDEPDLYAALSVIGRMDNPQVIAVDMFRDRFGKRNHGGTEADLLDKLDQAVKASGPRTCKNINSIWGGCKGCPHFGKISSPIVIQGENFIKTKDTGFHDIILKGNVPRIGKPNYQDLRRYFEQLHKYIVLGGSKRCFVWSETHWTELPDAYLENFAQEQFSPYANTAMVQEFKNLVCRTNLQDADWFVDSTNGRMNFKNGILNLATMAMEPHSEQYGFRYVLPYDYDPTAEAPLFRQFLTDITCGDQTLTDVLLEFAGYAFSSDTCWAGKCLIMTGEGSNGKSTFMEILRALAGKDNYAPLSLAELKQETNRQMIDGKLFNLAEETPTYSVMESSLFKNLVTGGETTVKMLYKQPYTIRNKCKLMFACNELPQTRDTTTGYFRRLMIVPFKQNFETNGRKDPFIEEKLKTELPGIFNLVIDGYRRLRNQRAFTQSSAIDRQLWEYRLELDTVEYWVETQITVLPQIQEPDAHDPYAVVSKMYSAYSLFTEARGCKPENAIAFGKRLSRKIPQYSDRSRQKKEGGRNERILYNVRMHDQGEF